MFYSGKGMLLGLGIFGSLIAYHEGDKFLNYSQVDAKITSVRIDCYIEGSREKIVKKATQELAYMDCAKASFAAKAFNHPESDIKRRATVAYEYKSPVDGRNQSGVYIDTYAQEGRYSTGKVVRIYANTSDAKVSMWN